MIREQEQMLLPGETEKDEVSSLGKESLDGRWWLEGILLICRAVLVGES